MEARNTYLQLLDLLESTANTLRGMSFDPRIPQEAKDVLIYHADALDEAVEARLVKLDTTAPAPGQEGGE